MFFGDEHLGKAVAMLREGADLNQKELAQEVGVEPNTMNQYESGRRGMSDETIFKLAGVLQRDPIEIWDLAYAIFRFNHFRERAEREGVATDELIARSETRPSPAVLMDLYDSRTARDREWTEAMVRFLDSVGRTGPGGLGLVRIVVQAHRHRSAKTRRAVRFRRKKQPGPPELP
ncbi:MAG TPA: helix-turn-helix transcriptional regulator [Thermoanaerobaculia bacterium]|jgi:transcriptional regulator with XRE-family HTH domain